jgi:ABC-2 type transport system permease protein
VKTLVGTGNLIRLILRRDRVRLLVWIAVLALVPVSTASAFIGLYPTEADRLLLVGTVGSNPALVAFLGPINGPSIGALTTWRVGVLGSVFVAIMASLTVIRHTREEEESGRRDLLGATVVGRNAPLTAALLVTSGVGLLVGVICAAGMIGLGLETTGSIAFGAGFAAAAIVFAALAGVAAQLTQGAGAARGIALGALGAFFLLRMIGDGNGEGGAAWLSWLSPIGWFTQVRPFADERWAVLALPLGLAVVATGAAFWLAGRRDVDAGVVAPRLGRAGASRALSSPSGLAWRLHRPSLIGWTIGLAFLGLVYGSVGDGIGGLISDSPQLADIFEQLGGEAGITAAFFATAMGILALVATAYAIRTGLRPKVEEETSRGDLVLATATTRSRWAGSHWLYAIVGPVLMLVVGGAVAGATYGAITGDLGGELSTILEAAVIQVPAVWVMVGLTILLFGVAPRLTVLAWAALVVSLLLGQLGRILQFPQWALNLSPYSHVPALPVAELDYTPLVILTVIALALTVVGFFGLRRRDLGV